MIDSGGMWFNRVGLRGEDVCDYVSVVDGGTGAPFFRRGDCAGPVF